MTTPASLTTPDGQAVPLILTDDHMGDVLRWHALLTTTEDLIGVTGWQLPTLMHHITVGDYDHARTALLTAIEIEQEN